MTIQTFFTEYCKHILIVIGVIFIGSALAVAVSLSAKGATFAANQFILQEEPVVLGGDADLDKPDFEPPTLGFFHNLDTTKEYTGTKSPFSGVTCENGERRPYAVTISNDPYSVGNSHSLTDADLVAEAPVSQGGISRLLALYVCGVPKEHIGPIRSVRFPFYEIAKAFDSILVHWGGEKYVQREITTDVWPHLDATGIGNDAFYRNYQHVAPNNGFVSSATVMKTAKDLGYRTTLTNSNNIRHAFSHRLGDAYQDRANRRGKLVIDYRQGVDTSFTYNAITNSYDREWGGAPHIDQSTGFQISPQNVIVMHTAMEHFYDDYVNFAIEDNMGRAEFYVNGKQVRGEWRHNIGSGTFEFYNERGVPLEFVPGQIWMNLVTEEHVIDFNPEADAPIPDEEDMELLRKIESGQEEMLIERSDRGIMEFDSRELYETPMLRY